MPELMEVVDALARALREPDPTPSASIVADPVHGSWSVVRDGYRLTKVEGPTKRRRKHQFDDLRSLARWLNRHATAGEESGVEVLVGAERVSAGLEPGNTHGDVVVCDLVKHPSFLAWLSAFEGGALSQKEFHYLVRANTDTLGEDAGESLSAELLKLSFVSGGELTTEIDVTGLTKFQGSTGSTNVSGKIPASFFIETPIVNGIREVLTDGTVLESTDQVYSLQVFVSMSLDESHRPKFSLSCPKLPIALAEARVDAARYLEALLDDGFEVLLGDYQTETVPAISS